MYKTSHDTSSSVCCCNECRTLRMMYNNDAGEPPSPRKPDQPRYGAKNASRADHIARLRKRARAGTSIDQLRSVVLGLIDLLEDDGQ